MSSPLADRIRPDSLDNVVGQQELVGENGILRRIAASGNIPNMIFYGPSGVGKTTVARILCGMTGKKLYKLNGTSASTADIKEIIAGVGTLDALGGVVLYLDEIQYLNKKQQQSLLEYIENGDITLIASTTENPYFYIYSAILSRCTVFQFKPITRQDVSVAVRRAYRILKEETGEELEVPDECIDYIAAVCGGDVRKALNAVELSASAAQEQNGKRTVTIELLQSITGKSGMRYDRDADEHYNILSAYQKSMRGSDPDAALHYLGRLFGKRGSTVRLPQAAGYRQRGCGPCFSAVYCHCEGMCGRSISTGSAGGAYPLGTGSCAGRHCAKVQQYLRCNRRGNAGHSKRPVRRRSRLLEGRTLQWRGENGPRQRLSVPPLVSGELCKAGLLARFAEGPSVLQLWQ